MAVQKFDISLGRTEVIILSLVSNQTAKLWKVSLKAALLHEKHLFLSQHFVFVISPFCFIELCYHFPWEKLLPLSKVCRIARRATQRLINQRFFDTMFYLAQGCLHTILKVMLDD